MESYRPPRDLTASVDDTWCARRQKRDQRSQCGGRRGVLTFTQYKGRNRNTLPILPALQRIIDASPCGDLTFLVNEFGSTVYGCGLRQQISGLGAIKPTCRSVPRTGCARRA